MKLKTLKDIEEDIRKGYEAVGDLDNFTFPDEELKQEAIKWVKELQYHNEFERESSASNVQEWIKHFFNITEEDLSQGMTQEVPK